MEFMAMAEDANGKVGSKMWWGHHVQVDVEQKESCTSWWRGQLVDIWSTMIFGSDSRNQPHRATNKNTDDKLTD